MSATAYKIKAIVSGPMVEFYKHEAPVFRRYKSNRGNKPPKELLQLDDYEVDTDTGEIITFEDKLAKKLESRAKSNIRSKNTVKRIVCCNFTNKSKFLTLTFRENMQDIDYANKCMTKFIRKMKAEQPDFKYLAVLELQEREAIHYHIICDMKYMRVEKIRDFWRGIVGEGNIDLKDIRGVANVGGYISDYMTKDTAHEIFIGKKLYQCSQGLKRPKELTGAQAEYLLRQMEVEKRKKVYESEYLNPQTETNIIYLRYMTNLKASSPVPAGDKQKTKKP